MLEERFRLMILSKDGTGLKQISLTWNKFCLAVIVLVLIFAGMTAFTLGVFTRLYHNYRVVSLENDKEKLQTELLTIKERVASLSTQLAQIETTSDELRSIADLPPIDEDVRQVGVGGPSYAAFLDYSDTADPLGKTAVEVKLDLEKLGRAIRLEKHSMAEIAARMSQQQDRIDHFPSINPVLGGPITSEFGWRTDPFTKKLDFHPAVDITVRKGTKVLATADGVVEIARTSHTPSQTYGNMIVIDHGYGLKTRYAHLSKLYVRRGQRVKKWEAIGEVGTTGRSQGPHLHYEVMAKGKQQDPRNFIYN